MLWEAVVDSVAEMPLHRLCLEPDGSVYRKRNGWQSVVEETAVLVYKSGDGELIGVPDGGIRITQTIFQFIEEFHVDFWRAHGTILEW
eukprot:4200024-Karenia_brevis.AAC.1